MAIITSTSAGGSEVNVRDDYTASGAVGALNAEVVLDLRGCNQVAIDFRSGAAVNLTVAYEASIDGTNYIAVPAFVVPTLVAALSSAIAAAGSVQAIAPVGGYRYFRARVSAYTSGSVTVSLRGSVAADLGIPAARPPYPATTHVTATAAVNTGVTLTLAAPGAGLRHFVTKFRIDRLYSVVGVAGAAANNVTTTNLSGSPIFPVGQTAAPAGTMETLTQDFNPPLQATAQNTATTFVAPAQLQTIWRLNAFYYVAP